MSLVHFLSNWTFVLTAFTFWKLAWLTRQWCQAASCLIPHHRGTDLTACHKNAAEQVSHIQTPLMVSTDGLCQVCMSNSVVTIF